MSEPILLIEDTASLQVVYATLLKKAGFEVDTASTAAEGARLFRGRRHRIVLLDLMLPDRDGQELLSEFLGREQATKVIVITSNGSINLAVSAMRTGAFDFLVKPFDDQRLLSAVKNALFDLGAEFCMLTMPTPPQRAPVPVKGTGTSLAIQHNVAAIAAMKATTTPVKGGQISFN